MSTNYYIDKKDRLPMEDLIHIGKSVFKKPNGEFIWAIRPKVLKNKALNVKPTDFMIVDEYGNKYTYFQFMEMVKDRKWDFDHVGECFS